MKQRTVRKNLRVTQFIPADRLYGKRLVYADKTRHELIAEFAKENGVKVCGNEHQIMAIPLFNDGTYCVYTMRAWGSLMAELWGGTYLDWYIKNF